MIKRIQEGPLPYESNGTVLEKIFKCCFLKPLKRNKAIRLGNMNEDSVLKSLIDYLKNEITDTDSKVTSNVIELELVVRNDAKWFASSVDGLVECYVDKNEVPELLPIEIKT